MSNEKTIARATENLAWETRTVPLGTQPGLAAVVEGVAVDARRI